MYTPVVHYVVSEFHIMFLQCIHNIMDIPYTTIKIIFHTDLPFLLVLQTIEIYIICYHSASNLLNRVNNIIVLILVAVSQNNLLFISYFSIFVTLTENLKEDKKYDRFPKHEFTRAHGTLINI